MGTEVVKDTKLSEMVEKAGLPKTTSQMLLEKFSHYFEMAADWEAKAKTIKVTSVDQKDDMAMARTGRLILRRKRIEVENTRKQLKEKINREGKAIDGIANVLKAAIAPIEEYLLQQENYEKIQLEKKAEAERIEAERIEKEEAEKQQRLDAKEEARRRMALPFYDFWPEDKEPNFRDMTDLSFNQFISNCKARKSEHTKEQEKIRKDKEAAEAKAQAAQEKARKQKEEAERKQREEKERHEEQLRKEKAKAKREKEKQAEKARIAAQKAEREKAKQDAKIKKLEQERERERALQAGKLTPSEALYAFTAGLTTRKESITIGSKHDASIMAELVRDFCKAHDLEAPSENYTDKVVPMGEKTWPTK